jgi:tyrosine-protein kinase Etk/Wzc
MKNSSRPLSSSSLLKEYLKKAVSFKLFYLICLIVFGTSAFLINKFSIPVYQVTASILLAQNNRQSSAILGSTELFKGSEFMQDNKNIENETSMLSSFSLVESAITSLNFEVAYFIEKPGLLKQKNEIYLESPITVTIDKSHNQPFDVDFYVDILNDSSFRLSASKEEILLYNYVDNEIESKSKNFSINNVYKFNQTISTNYFRFSVTLNQKNSKLFDKGNKLFFKLNHLDYITMSYLSRMKIEPVSPLASILSISYMGENLDKIRAFLNKYIELYLNANLEKKNKISVNTIKFIDSQISQISDSLVSSEANLRDYKSANQVMDLSFQGQRIFDQMSQIETERANMEVQKQYYKYIIDYFDKNKDFSRVVPPASMNVMDPIMNQLITELISLNSERSSIVNTNSQKNLFLAEIENKIKMQKEAILENVKNNLNTLNLSINELNYRSNKLSGEISKLPKTEIKMVGMERKFKLNDAIYTFLLQKRAESEITRESNSPDYEILEPAREITSTVISPKKTVNYGVALFLALLLPSLFILGKEYLNDKISSVYEFEHLSRHKVIGIIYKNKHKEENIVFGYPRSSVAESFRTLRTNLFIKLNVETSRLILITSSLPREGKSFVSFNLAASIASMGYKTLIIDCDLRRSTLHQKFKVDNTLGLSTCLANKSLVDDIIVPTFDQNLFFIPAGPVYPNPAELIESGVCDKLFGYLKSHFDYIIIDTPPIGAVADSLLLMKYATLTLFISRQNYTRKNIFVDAINSLESNNFNNYEIVFNDFNYKKSEYGQYYSNYYSEEKNAESTGFKKLIKKHSKIA